MTTIKRNKLTDDQYAVAREGATEPPFSGVYNYEKRKGSYLCVTCDQKLFDSEAKYESGLGWPAFYAPFDEANIVNVQDTSYGMIRTEVKCSKCDSHLGHVFPDGPEPTTATLLPVLMDGILGLMNPSSQPLSTIVFSINSIVTGSSLMFNTHDASHGAAQILPVNSGKLLVECNSSKASFQFP